MAAAALGIGLAAVARPACITSGREQDLGASRGVAELERRTWAVLDAAPHRAMAGLRERGVRLGVSTSGPEQASAVRRALEVTVDGEPLFTSVQTTWNPLETSAGEALAEAARACAQVIVKEALANGRLASRRGDGTPGVTRMQAIAQAEGLPVDVLALAAALHRPWATYVLSGGVTAEQVVSNAGAADVRLTPGVLDALDELAEAPRACRSARSQRPWS